MRFADLKYSDTELEQDALKYLKTQIYAPAYIEEVKDFLQNDLIDFKRYYDDDEYAFHNIYFDEYVLGYTEDEDENLLPKVDFQRLSAELEDDFERLNMSDEEVEEYSLLLEAEFRKNAFCSHSEPYFLGYDAVVNTVIAGYSRNPIFSIYSMVREWDMALHLKKMYPEQMRKFGYRYQKIRLNYSGEERFKKMIQFRDKYSLTIQTISALRAVHSSVFAYVYLYLRAFMTGETAFIRDFILETSSSQIYLLLQGENIKNIDFPMVKYALEQLKDKELVKMLLRPSGMVNWDALYQFVDEVIHSAGGVENLRSLGYDGIDAKTIRSFWNKSANMQKMLKILRRLAMDNNDPIINQLIEMCEYRLGRPNSDSEKKKMERFLEYTRRLLAARSFELTRPRTMDQQLIAAFPSVFLVYFQWHHNFRNIYPKVPKKQQEYNLDMQKKRQAEDTLRNRIYTEDKQQKNKIQQEEKLRSRMHQDKSNTNSFSLNLNNEQKNRADEDKIRTIAQNRERTVNELKQSREDMKISVSSLNKISEKQNSF